MTKEPKYAAVKGEIDGVDDASHAIGRIVYQVGASSLWEVFSRDDLDESYTIVCKRSGVVVGVTRAGVALIQTSGVLPSTRVAGDIAAASEAGLLGGLKILYPEGEEPEGEEDEPSLPSQS